VRIVIATRHRDHVGGVESYLETLMPMLRRRGHELLFWSERAGTNHAIAVPDGVQAITADESAGTANGVSGWAPDVVFAHGLSDPAHEDGLLATAPTVLFLHAYHGTCVSGTKRRAFPSTRPCERAFGPGCLVQYLPRRCGGLSPITMVTLYRAEAAHHERLPRYSHLVVLSDHMKREAVRQGLPAERVSVVSPPIDGAAAAIPPSRRTRLLGRRADGPLRLLFLGRFEHEKGGHLLIEALPSLARRAGIDVQATFVGDGRLRADWERRARRGSNSRVEVRWPGRVAPGDRNRWFEWADLLVVPSLWPEPFGLVGPEAAVHGVPAVAFDSGGIRQWLIDERTGRLAAPGRFDSESLADAIAWCAEGQRLLTLSDGAVTQATSWSLDRHAEEVEAILKTAQRGRVA
jgi:glycosyltransferase involved in cell wall biosynthesis